MLESNFKFDYNLNHIQDGNENWNVWQAADDNSCWMAASTNLMSYLDGTNRYNQSAYAIGIEYFDPKLGSDDLKFWTDGGRPQKAIEAWGFNEVFHSDNGLDEGGAHWDSSPIGWIKEEIDLGLPVALNVEWDPDGAHAFTVYGIDDVAHTMLIADSDSDRNGTEYYEIPYRAACIKLLLHSTSALEPRPWITGRSAHIA